MLNEFIFGELSQSEFRANYLDKKPALLRGASDLFKVLNLDWIDEYLSSLDGSLHTFVRLITNSKDEAFQATNAYSFESQKSILEKKFQAGSTLVIADLDGRSDVVAKLSRNLESTFGGQISSNAFLTPQRQTGFEIHFDPTSAFVVQLEGEKQWKVYARVSEFPTQQMLRKTTVEEHGEPVLDVLLCPGDVLYIPGGYPHAPLCLDKHSLHVTLAVEAWRTSDLLAYQLNRLSHLHPALRRPLYLGDANAIKHMENAIGVLREQIDSIEAPQAVEEFRIAYNTNRPDANRHGLRSSAYSSYIQPTSAVVRVRDKPTSVRRNGDSVTIYPASTIRPGRPLLVDPVRIDLPIYAATEVESILMSDTPQRVSDIPGVLDISSKITLVRRLMRYGLVEISTESGSLEQALGASSAEHGEQK